jgi:ribosomal-protein-alanine N-acetyltransferase
MMQEGRHRWQNPPMATVDVELGLAGLRHAETLAVMSRDLIEAGLGWGYRPERMAKLITARDTTTLVAHERARCVGFAVMTFGDERAHLILLAVRPSHRRRGVGRQMMAWLLDSAMTAGMASVHLELLEDNAAARAFYHALGFTETIRLPGYYRGQKAAVRMTLILRAPGLRIATWQPPARG